jgi:hypothetical protein
MNTERERRKERERDEKRERERVIGYPRRTWIGSTKNITLEENKNRPDPL